MDDSLDPNIANKTNFHYPTLLLPAEKRKALLGLYWFCRKADDIADEPGSRSSKRKALARFQRELKKAWAGMSRDPILGPFLEAARPLGLTRGPLQTILKGVRQDIRGIRFERFPQLHAYALKVAGAPGLACMEIFGFRDEPHRRYARDLGVFLQLTNIVRDVVEDHGLGRRYLPGRDWRRFGLDPRALPSPGPAWDCFVRFQLDRAWTFWRKACESLGRHERGRLATAEAIAAVYARLHRKLYDDPSRILRGRVGLSKPEKVWAVLRTSLRCLVWKGLPNP